MPTYTYRCSVCGATTNEFRPTARCYDLCFAPCLGFAERDEPYAVEPEVQECAYDQLVLAPVPTTFKFADKGACKS